MKWLSYEVGELSIMWIMKWVSYEVGELWSGWVIMCVNYEVGKLWSWYNKVGEKSGFFSGSVIMTRSNKADEKYILEWVN